jgi:hypothetical protein
LKRAVTAVVSSEREGVITGEEESDKSVPPVSEERREKGIPFRV